MEDNKLIAADDVTLAYEGYVAAEHVGFTLDRGDYLCVVGENGSGKSTLLKAITGEIRIGGGKLTLAEELLKNGRTKEKVTGFTARSGSLFDA